MAMITAKELRGIVPQKTLTGRIVNHDDPPILHISDQTRGTGLMGQVIEFIERANGRFTGFDVAEALGTYKNVTAYLHNLRRKGMVRIAGKAASSRDKHGRVTVWERV